MSEFKGTKGEWKSKGYNVYSDNDKNVEFIHGNVICYAPEHLYRSMDNWQANAKLIACAPEMLEMLKELKNRFEHFVDEVSVLEIEQLIKKATE